MAKQTAGVSFTDTKRVKELVALMTANDLTEIELVEDKSKITLKRGGVVVAAPVSAVPGHVSHPSHSAAGAAPVPPAEEEEPLIAIKSPMVGTYYAAANPESDPYVSVGGAVGEDTVVCIIEAMKVFNEIRAETNGTIVKIMVTNGQVVEFGQPLFMVKPN